MKNIKRCNYAVIVLLFCCSSLVFAYSGGDGTAGNPYQISNVADFQLLSATPTDWGKSFTLTANINLSGLTFTQAPIAPDTYNIGSDFQGTQFTGTFDGNGHVISNLTITASTQDYVGLFGYVGTGGKISNLGVEDVNVTGSGAVGGLVGNNGDWKNGYGTITSCHVTGLVTGTAQYSSVGGLVGNNDKGIVISSYATGSVSGDQDVGGLIGANNSYSTITTCYAASLVSGTYDIGGLVGWNGGALTTCYATGSVSGTVDYIGGLVGENGGVLTSCHATGDVNGQGDVGGLVGKNYYGSLTSCYATGDVNSQGDVGGLVGKNDESSLTACYATGSVRGSDYAGGLVGYNNWYKSHGVITSCYATGSVTGGDCVAGLVGYNYAENGSITNCYSTSPVVSGTDDVGGLVGLNYWGNLTSCYATGSVIGTGSYVGGLVGYNISYSNYGIVTSCFWDTETSSLNYSEGGTGKTTAEMKILSTFTDAGWDFTTVWAIKEGIDYPKLKWPYIPPQQTGNLQVTLTPAAAVSAGSQWNVDSGTWQNSTVTVTGLSVGSHTVNYKPITGWTKPISEQVTITASQTNSISRSYTQLTSQPSQFGTLNGKSIKLTLKDTYGADVTFSLTGGGYGEMDPCDKSFSTITLYDTTEKSLFTITSKAETSIGSIIANGPLKGIVAKTTNLRGDIEVDGSLGTLTLNDVADNHTITIGSPAIPNPKAATTFTFDRVSDLAIDSGMPIKSFTATEWLVGSIDAPSVGSITTKGDKKRSITGDLDVDVTSGTIQSIKIAGTLSGDWTCDSIKSISAAQIVETNLSLSRIPDSKNLALGKLTTTGWIDSSQILSQGNIGTVTAGAMINSSCFAGVAEGITGLPTAEATSFPETATIKSIAIKGIRTESSPYYINSNIAAANILSVSVVYPKTDNSGVPFGLSANYIKKLTIKKNDGKSVLLKELKESKDSQTIDGVEIRLY